MPFRRSFTRRRRPVNARRAGRMRIRSRARRTFRTRIPRQLSLKSGVHFFKRTADFTNISAGISALATNCTVGYNPGNFAINWATLGSGAEMYATLGIRFNINQIPNITEFSNLFDQYSLRKVVVKFVPWTNDAPVTVTGNLLHSTSPILDYCIDLDDADPPSPSQVGLQQLRERNNHKTVRMFKPHTIVIKPRARGGIGVADSSVQPIGLIRPRWINLSEPNVPYFGLKLIFSGINPGAAGSFIMRATVTYYVKFKGPR